jgi:hypothetical protein
MVCAECCRKGEGVCKLDGDFDKKSPFKWSRSLLEILLHAKL